MIRVVVPLLLLAACSPGTTVLGVPVPGLASPEQNAAYIQRRGAVELIVKSRPDAVLDQIAAGGGPDLTEAMNAAGIPVADRPARLLQLRADSGLYGGNLGALVSALVLYGG